MTVLDAFDLAACDDTTLERLASRIIKTSPERLSAHASMARGGWSTSGTTEGATA